MAVKFETGVTVMEVEWHIPVVNGDLPERRVTIVALHDGYSTVEDIPKIIVTKRTGDPSLAYLIIVDKVTPL